MIGSSTCSQRMSLLPCQVSASSSFSVGFAIANLPLDKMFLIQRDPLLGLDIHTATNL
ncbi:hypothetical protein [Mesorhizobium sp. M7D.F.Ca.US.004.03.1.1]|uniref:hypothetical protein n=1 Tax=Mesorhizobium sp. M7D.F.Ca.US.004.03.1.1 TaxID=2496702 RepID=UPI001FDF2895|nr:hypothetical protein [Mesorhizobium sp. M7D.F.Ca.US.004.03.1.1]